MWQHYVPQNIFFWKLEVMIRPLPCWQQDSILLNLLLECIHKFIIELHVLQFLFARGSNKQQRRRGINFFVSYDNQVFLVISQCGLFSHSPKRAFLFSSVWPQREYTWTLNWKETLLICFENCQGVPYPHKQSRNRMINTFIIVNTIPICKR